MQLQHEEVSLHDLLVNLRARRRVIVWTVLASLAAATVYCVLATPRFDSTAVVQVQKDGSESLGLDSMLGGGAGATDSLSANVELETQAHILQSDSLALETIKILNLEHTADFDKKSFLSSLMSSKTDDASTPLENSPRRRVRALKIFQRNLTVQPVTGTRLIEISYMNPDPKVAADVVNTLTQALSDYTFQTRYQATNQTTKWLNEQLGGLRATSEGLQAKVLQLQRESGVYSQGTSDSQGKPQAYSIALDRLEQASQALRAAEQSRIVKEAISHAAESGDADLLSGLAGNTLSTDPGAAGNALAVIQNLRQQLATQQATLADAEVKYGSNYPKLDEMRAGIAQLQKNINQEIARVADRAKSDYQIAQQTEDSTRKQFEEAKKDASALNDKMIQYMVVREEADQSRTLYDDLLKRLDEAGVLAGLHSSNITVVDPGRASDKPKVPSFPKIYLSAFVIGLILGVALALLIHTLDRKISGITAFEEMFGENVFGALPLIEQTAKAEGSATGASSLAASLSPHSTYMEAVRAIRTSISLSQLREPPKVILVTSSIAGEGKSTFSVNLATTYAQSGKKTLLIDTDLRRGLLRMRLNIPRSKGLSELLAGVEAEPTIHAINGIPNLYLLATGTPPPNPTDLLSSASMREWIDRLRNSYDCIILDSAPVLPVTDSVALNSDVDVTVILGRSNYTEKVQVRRAFQILSRNSNHFIGLVLNGLDPRDASSSGYYGYHGYRDYVYGGEDASGQ